MNDLPLNALRALAAVYASGGVRAAGRELGVAHSSVSRHIAELEGWLGVPLVVGAGRAGLAFTPQGHALGKAALAGLRDIAAAALAVRETRSARSVTISTTPSFAARWLLPRLPGLERAHADLEVSVLVEQKLDDLSAGGIDVAIRMGRGPWAGVRSKSLMDDSLFPVMSPSFHAASGRPRRTDKLVGLRLLHDRDPNASWEAWRRVHGPPSLDVRRGPRFASSDLVLRAAAQGQGVALARGRLASAELATGALIRPFGDRAVALEAAYWLVLPERDPTRAAALVLAWLEKEAAAPSLTEPGPA